MEENQYAHMNKYIDSMPMIMNWEIDTFIAIVLAIGMAVIFQGTFAYLSLFGGVSFAVFNEILKNTKYKNYLTHVLYSYGLKNSKSKRIPQSHVKVFVG